MAMMLWRDRRLHPLFGYEPEVPGVNSASKQLEQHLPGAYGVARGHVNCFDDPIHGGPDRDFHLHCFDYDHRLVAPHFAPGVRYNRGHAPGDR